MGFEKHSLGQNEHRVQHGRRVLWPDKEVTSLNEKHVPFWKGVLNLFAALGRLLSGPGLWISILSLILIAQVLVAYTQELTPVTLVVDGVSQEVHTRCSSVQEVLSDIGIPVGEWDYISPDQETRIQSGMTVHVQHARPVTLITDGTTRTLYTHNHTLGAILREAGIELLEGDRIAVDGQWVEEVYQRPQQGTNQALNAFPQERMPASYSLSSRGWRSHDTLPLSSRIEIQRAKTIYVQDDRVERVLNTTAQTVGQALIDGNTILYAGDSVSPSLDTPVTAGLHIYIQRAVPVSVTVDGRTLRTRTRSGQIGQVLAELGVSLLGNDFVRPPLDADVVPNLVIQVVRVTEKVFVEQEEIPFETEWVADPSLEIDHQQVQDVGSPGLISRRNKIVYYDGQEVHRALEEQWVAREPQSRKIAYGTQIVIRTLETPQGPVEYWRRIRVFLTAYTAATCGKTPDHPEYGITRLGWKMRHGIIAVDPQVIRLRSQLYVPGYGPGVAGDTGGLIRGRHIDLGYDEDNLVWHYEWGYVYVLTPVPPPGQIRWILPDFPQER